MIVLGYGNQTVKRQIYNYEQGNYTNQDATFVEAQKLQNIGLPFYTCINLINSENTELNTQNLVCTKQIHRPQCNLTRNNRATSHSSLGLQC